MTSRRERRQTRSRARAKIAASVTLILMAAVMVFISSAGQAELTDAGLYAASPAVTAQDATETPRPIIHAPEATLQRVAATEPPATTPEPEPEPEKTCEGNCLEGNCPFFEGYPEPPYTERDIVMLAQTVWGEARGCTPEEQRLVVWTVLQRVDSDCHDFARHNTIEAALRYQNAFVGFSDYNPVNPDIYALVAEELTAWAHGAEPPTHDIYAPTLPYLYFDGDGGHNWFRAKWR